jgi:hypothetical protein
MSESEEKQRATDALLAKFVNGLNLKRVESLPQPVYGFNPGAGSYSFSAMGVATAELANTSR